MIARNKNRFRNAHHSPLAVLASETRITPNSVNTGQMKMTVAETKKPPLESRGS
jgi:hypothetical protein